MEEYSEFCFSIQPIVPAFEHLTNKSLYIKINIKYWQAMLVYKNVSDLLLISCLA